MMSLELWEEKPKEHDQHCLILGGTYCFDI
jgi:hypothetical protein